MNKYRITESGKRARELRKTLREKERVSPEEALKIAGEDVYKNGDGLTWLTIDKNQKVTVKRDVLPHDAKQKRIKKTRQKNHAGWWDILLITGLAVGVPLVGAYIIDHFNKNYQNSINRVQF